MAGPSDLEFLPAKLSHSPDSCNQYQLLWWMLESVCIWLTYRCLRPKQQAECPEAPALAQAKNSTENQGLDRTFVYLVLLYIFMPFASRQSVQSSRISPYKVSLTQANQSGFWLRSDLKDASGCCRELTSQNLQTSEQPWETQLVLQSDLAKEPKCIQRSNHNFSWPQ